MLGLIMQIHAQDRVSLYVSHNPINRPIIYIVDFLRLDSLTFFSIGQFQKSEIKRVRANHQESTIICTTKFLVVFNEELLSSKKEKSKLSNVNFADVESIKIEREKAVEMYGKKGKKKSVHKKKIVAHASTNFHVKR